MLEKLEAKLVNNWRNAWKWWSMRLNLIASVAVAYLLSSPELILTTLNQLPPEMRAFFPPAIGFVLFAVVAGVRIWKQKNPKNPNG